jgi:ABC-type bacteriocin/lantibiotic exporter with double-glycine peptidase domain
MFDITPITSPIPVDCGPTCLKMLLAYYGTEVDLDTLIKECNTRIAGCSAKDLNRVGRAHGLDMKAFEMDAEELIRQDRPAIVWWKYDHWCVFCGKDDSGKVVIVNPDRGRYGMSAGIFKSFYSGVSLWNGEPEDLPEPVSDEATAADYTEALEMLGVEVPE